MRHAIAMDVAVPMTWDGERWAIDPAQVDAASGFPHLEIAHHPDNIDCVCDDVSECNAALATAESESTFPSGLDLLEALAEHYGKRLT